MRVGGTRQPRAARLRRGGPIRSNPSMLAMLSVETGKDDTDATAGWMLAGGSLPSSQFLFGQAQPPVVESSAGASVHVDSSPAGAQLHIDGENFGRTPLDVRLSPGQHTLSLQRPDALDY